MHKPLKIFILFLFISVQLTAQSKESRWVFGAGFGVAKFASKDAAYIGDQFNFQIPRLHATRYFFKGLSLDAGVAFNTLNKLPGLSNSISYLSLDGAVKYDFGTTDDTIVSYLMLGGSFVKANEIITPTINFGGGGTYWMNARYGINVQLIYKHSLSIYKSMRPHGYFSIGVVYSLELRTLIPRLWNNN